VHTRTILDDRSRAAVRVMPTTPALGSRVRELADLTLPGRDRRSHDADATVAVEEVVGNHPGRRIAQDI
jgi:hypothetical protein